ncbi:MAG: ABC transporter permease [Gammaproteobacteria bacterium]|nr:ABC transporter permease [Gammaproteobacteria bacterium]
MRPEDVLHYTAQALTGNRRRSLLMLLAMAIGVGAVVMLTALGEGARRYVTNQFSDLGTNLVIVFPGRSETVGGPPPMLGETPRDLTLADALSLYRSLAVQHVAPLVIGAAPVSWKQREREVMILGSTSALEQIRHLELAQGRFLPKTDPERGAPFCVIGPTVKQELFGNTPALGQWLRIGDYRFRVIGVLSAKGQSLGTDLNDMVVIPVASAQTLFNTESLFRILVQAKGRDSLDEAQSAIKSIMRDRHDGEEDVTVITQDAVLATFDRIFTALTFTVGGIAAVSLAVAGILIMNIMLVAISQRTAEIGLLKALGAPASEILTLFLSEAGLLSLLGGLIGLAVGLLGTALLGHIFPTFPISAPNWAIIGALSVALITGLVFGWLPARRAAQLDPVQALTRR